MTGPDRFGIPSSSAPDIIWVLERLREFHVDLGVEYHVTLSWLYVAADRLGEARLEGEFARVLNPQSPGLREWWAHLGS